ncbi:MAG: DUF89 family protein, partial [Candidatus Omnitrophica bacterium]|nr:DUF89 family protein [Candidatus Omnitrophota bacterium]
IEGTVIAEGYELTQKDRDEGIKGFGKRRAAENLLVRRLMKLWPESVFDETDETAEKGLQSQRAADEAFKMVMDWLKSTDWLNSVSPEDLDPDDPDTKIKDLTDDLRAYKNLTGHGRLTLVATALSILMSNRHENDPDLNGRERLLAGEILLRLREERKIDLEKPETKDLKKFKTLDLYNRIFERIFDVAGFVYTAWWDNSEKNRGTLSEGYYDAFTAAHAVYHSLETIGFFERYKDKIQKNGKFITKFPGIRDENGLFQPLQKLEEDAKLVMENKILPGVRPGEQDVNQNPYRHVLASYFAGNIKHGLSRLLTDFIPYSDYARNQVVSNELREEGRNRTRQGYSVADLIANGRLNYNVNTGAESVLNAYRREVEEAVAHALGFAFIEHESEYYPGGDRQARDEWGNTQVLATARLIEEVIMADANYKTKDAEIKINEPKNLWKNWRRWLGAALFSIGGVLLISGVLWPFAEMGLLVSSAKAGWWVNFLADFLNFVMIKEPLEILGRLITAAMVQKGALILLASIVLVLGHNFTAALWRLPKWFHEWGESEVNVYDGWRRFIPPMNKGRLIGALIVTVYVGTVLSLAFGVFPFALGLTIPLSIAFALIAGFFFVMITLPHFAFSPYARTWIITGIITGGIIFYSGFLNAAAVGGIFLIAIGVYLFQYFAVAKSLLEKVRVHHQPLGVASGFPILEFYGELMFSVFNPWGTLNQMANILGIKSINRRESLKDWEFYKDFSVMINREGFMKVLDGLKQGEGENSPLLLKRTKDGKILIQVVNGQKVDNEKDMPELRSKEDLLHLSEDDRKKFVDALLGSAEFQRVKREALKHLYRRLKEVVGSGVVDFNNPRLQAALQSGAEKFIRQEFEEAKNTTLAADMWTVFIQEILEAAGDKVITFFPDNSGEVVYDLAFVQEVIQFVRLFNLNVNGRVRVNFVPKAIPATNDATQEDVEFILFDKGLSMERDTATHHRGPDGKRTHLFWLLREEYSRQYETSTLGKISLYEAREKELKGLKDFEESKAGREFNSISQQLFELSRGIGEHVGEKGSDTQKQSWKTLRAAEQKALLGIWYAENGESASAIDVFGRKTALINEWLKAQAADKSSSLNLEELDALRKKEVVQQNRWIEKLQEGAVKKIKTPLVRAQRAVNELLDRDDMLFRVIPDGYRVQGIDALTNSNRLERIFDGSDLIVGKGQAVYETTQLLMHPVANAFMVKGFTNAVITGFHHTRSPNAHLFIYRDRVFPAFDNFSDQGIAKTLVYQPLGVAPMMQWLRGIVPSSRFFKRLRRTFLDEQHGQRVQANRMVAQESFNALRRSRHEDFEEVYEMLTGERELEQRLAELDLAFERINQKARGAGKDPIPADLINELHNIYGFDDFYWIVTGKEITDRGWAGTFEGFKKEIRTTLANLLDQNRKQNFLSRMSISDHAKAGDVLTILDRELHWGVREELQHLAVRTNRPNDPVNQISAQEFVQYLINQGVKAAEFVAALRRADPYFETSFETITNTNLDGALTTASRGIPITAAKFYEYVLSQMRGKRHREEAPVDQLLMEHYHRPNPDYDFLLQVFDGGRREALKNIQNSLEENFFTRQTAIKVGVKGIQKATTDEIKSLVGENGLIDTLKKLSEKARQRLTRYPEAFHGNDNENPHLRVRETVKVALERLRDSQGYLDELKKAAEEAVRPGAPRNILFEIRRLSKLVNAQVEGSIREEMFVFYQEEASIPIEDADDTRNLKGILRDPALTALRRHENVWKQLTETYKLEVPEIMKLLFLNDQLRKRTRTEKNPDGEGIIPLEIPLRSHADNDAAMMNQVANFFNANPNLKNILRKSTYQDLFNSAKGQRARAASEMRQGDKASDLQFGTAAASLLTSPRLGMDKYNRAKQKIMHYLMSRIEDMHAFLIMEDYERRGLIGSLIRDAELRTRNVINKYFEYVGRENVMSIFFESVNEVLNSDQKYLPALDVMRRFIDEHDGPLPDWNRTLEAVIASPKGAPFKSVLEELDNKFRDPDFGLNDPRFLQFIIREQQVIHSLRALGYTIDTDHQPFTRQMATAKTILWDKDALRPGEKAGEQGDFRIKLERLMNREDILIDERLSEVHARYVAYQALEAFAMEFAKNFGENYLFTTADGKTFKWAQLDRKKDFANEEQLSSIDAGGESLRLLFNRDFGNAQIVVAGGYGTRFSPEGFISKTMAAVRQGETNLRLASNASFNLPGTPNVLAVGDMQLKALLREDILHNDIWMEYLIRQSKPHEEDGASVLDLDNLVMDTKDLKKILGEKIMTHPALSELVRKIRSTKQNSTKDALNLLMDAIIFNDPAHLGITINLTSDVYPEIDEAFLDIFERIQLKRRQMQKNRRNGGQKTERELDQIENDEALEKEGKYNLGSIVESQKRAKQVGTNTIILYAEFYGHGDAMMKTVRYLHGKWPVETSELKHEKLAARPKSGEGAEGVEELPPDLFRNRPPLMAGGVTPVDGANLARHYQFVFGEMRGAQINTKSDASFITYLKHIATGNIATMGLRQDDERKPKGKGTPEFGTVEAEIKLTGFSDWSYKAESQKTELERVGRQLRNWKRLSPEERDIERKLRPSITEDGKDLINANNMIFDSRAIDYFPVMEAESERLMLEQRGVDSKTGKPVLLAWSLIAAAVHGARRARGLERTPLNPGDEKERAHEKEWRGNMANFGYDWPVGFIDVGSAPSSQKDVQRGNKDLNTQTKQWKNFLRSLPYVRDDLKKLWFSITAGPENEEPINKLKTLESLFYVYLESTLKISKFKMRVHFDAGSVFHDITMANGGKMGLARMIPGAEFENAFMTGQRYFVGGNWVVKGGKAGASGTAIDAAQLVILNDTVLADSYLISGLQDQKVIAKDGSKVVVKDGKSVVNDSVFDSSYIDPAMNFDHVYAYHVIIPQHKPDLNKKTKKNEVKTFSKTQFIDIREEEKRLAQQLIADPARTLTDVIANHPNAADLTADGVLTSIAAALLYLNHRVEEFNYGLKAEDLQVRRDHVNQLLAQLQIANPTAHARIAQIMRVADHVVLAFTPTMVMSPEALNLAAEFSEKQNRISLEQGQNLLKTALQNHSVSTVASALVYLEHAYADADRNFTMDNRANRRYQARRLMRLLNSEVESGEADPATAAYLQEALRGIIFVDANDGNTRVHNIQKSTKSETGYYRPGEQEFEPSMELETVLKAVDDDELPTYFDPENPDRKISIFDRNTNTNPDAKNEFEFEYMQKRLRETEGVPVQKTSIGTWSHWIENSGTVEMDLVGSPWVVQDNIVPYFFPTRRQHRTDLDPRSRYHPTVDMDYPLNTVGRFNFLTGDLEVDQAAPWDNVDWDGSTRIDSGTTPRNVTLYSTYLGRRWGLVSVISNRVVWGDNRFEKYVAHTPPEGWEFGTDSHYEPERDGYTNAGSAAYETWAEDAFIGAGSGMNYYWEQWRRVHYRERIRRSVIVEGRD